MNTRTGRSDLSVEYTASERTFSVSVPVRAGVLFFKSVKFNQDDSAFLQLCKLGDQLEELHRDRNISDVPGIHFARRLFRNFGLEPTKHRPSSEALLRRALKNLGLPRINNVVDVSNLCALDFLLPNGIYDLASCKGDICLRTGRQGEHYEALNNRNISLENRLCLADGAGPFGSPVSDSRRTGVNSESTELLAVIYGPDDYPEEMMIRNCRKYSEAMRHYCGAETITTDILSEDGVVILSL